MAFLSISMAGELDCSIGSTGKAALIYSVEMAIFTDLIFTLISSGQISVHFGL